MTRRRMTLVTAMALVVAACSGSVGADGVESALQSEVADGEAMASIAATTPTTTTTASITPATTESTVPEPDRAELTLASLSLDQKVGQLFMPVLAGRDPSVVSRDEERLNRDATGWATPAEIVSAYHLGGVIYLANNIGSSDQVGLLSAGLQGVAATDTGIGLLVAVDQEGGRVNRITDGVTVFPSAAALSGDAEAVREAGYVTGSQVANLGVNVVLAPVADVTLPGADSFIGNRSFGSDPGVVAEMVGASVEGLQGSGVAAAVKHWPGHGGTRVDSHRQLPVLDDLTRAEWDERERLAFQAAIERDVSIVLVGHLAVPAIDPTGTPATFSPVLIDELLRRELGFDGVVMTDALNMGAVAGIEPGRLVIDAVNAGVDILLVPPELGTAYRALYKAVESGEVSEDRLDAAVLRVLRLKDHLGLLPPVDG